MATEYHYICNGERLGPVSVDELRQLAASGRITAVDLLWEEGMPDWLPAGRFKGLIPTAEPVPQVMPPPLPTRAEVGIAGSNASSATVPMVGDGAATAATSTSAEPNPWVTAGKVHARTIITDLRTMDLRREIVPVDETNVAALLNDGIFWFATLLGIVPLLIGTLERADAQTTAFALFFAAVWGAVFRSAILNDRTRWGLLIAATLFTGIVGTFVAAALETAFLPKHFPENGGYLGTLLGFVVVVGPVEELCKLVPVVAYLGWRRSSARPMTLVIIGVFSGLGFAAFENLGYAQLAILRVALRTEAIGLRGLAEGVREAVANGMLRSLSCVFCHAVWTGTFAYFLATAWISRRRSGALIVIGLALTSLLHGTYDWLEGMQPTLAALIAGGSFILFYGYIAKLRGLIAEGGQGDTLAVPQTPADAAAP